MRKATSPGTKAAPAPAAARTSGLRLAPPLAPPAIGATAKGRAGGALSGAGPRAAGYVVYARERHLLQEDADEHRRQHDEHRHPEGVRYRRSQRGLDGEDGRLETPRPLPPQPLEGP